MLKKMLMGVVTSVFLIGLSGCGGGKPHTPTLLERYGTNKNELKNAPLETQLKVVESYPFYIKHIPNPNEKVQLAAVSSKPIVIAYIKNPSEKVQLAAVTHVKDISWISNKCVYQWIKNPSEKVQLAAVKQNGLSIMYIKNPSEKVQLAAVKQNVEAISAIKNPSEKVQLAAVKQNGEIISRINNPIEKVQLLMIKDNPKNIYQIKKPSLAVQLAYFKVKSKNKLAELEVKEGEKFEKNGNNEKAFYWYKLASNNGYDVADMKLGFLYSEGKGVKQNHLTAAKYFEKAANRKLILVGVRYNACYEYYEAGVYQKALQYCKKSDLPDAYNVLGLMYEYGKGVKMDKIKAYKLYLKATKKGNQESQLNLDRLCKNSSWACK
jgi:TPR repeat protein